MATKTISIDLRAYERLRQARRSADESFSQVIHRAKWPPLQKRCGDLLNHLLRRRPYLPAKDIRRLEQGQAQDAPPKRRWN